MMRRTKQRRPRLPKQNCIKIYTTPDVVEAFTARAAEQHRSISKHGEFLVVQDLAAAERDVPVEE